MSNTQHSNTLTLLPAGAQVSYLADEGHPAAVDVVALHAGVCGPGETPEISVLDSYGQWFGLSELAHGARLDLAPSAPDPVEDMRELAPQTRPMPVPVGTRFALDGETPTGDHLVVALLITDPVRVTMDLAAKGIEVLTSTGLVYPIARGKLLPPPAGGAVGSPDGPCPHRLMDPTHDQNWCDCLWCTECGKWSRDSGMLLNCGHR